MKKLTSLILLTIFLTTLAACGLAKEPTIDQGETIPAEGEDVSTVVEGEEAPKFTSIEEKTAGWQTYGDENSALTFMYPPDWKAQVNEDERVVTLSFGRGEQIKFQVEGLSVVGDIADLARAKKQETNGYYTTFLTTRKYFYTIFTDFLAAKERVFVKGFVFYSHELSSTAEEALPAFEVEFDMSGLDISVTEAKGILKERKYKQFWYVLHTLHLK